MIPGELVISQSEHKERVEKVKAEIGKNRVHALYLTSPTRILYLTGFSHISTERPLALVVPGNGSLFLMGPQLEYDHVKRDCPLVEEVFTYPDYPGLTHPIRYFAKILSKKGFDGARIATDSFLGAAGGWGYRGSSLESVMPRTKFVDGKDIVDKMRIVKSSQEIRLLKESAKWSAVAHDILLESTRPGSSDTLVGLKASFDALGKMLRGLGRRYLQLKWGLSPVIVGFRGQVGPESAIPHAVFAGRRIRRGDVLVTEAGVEVGGYTAELERTIVVGKPSARAMRYFEAMLKAQSAALHAFRPGIPCGRVDGEAGTVIRDSGFGECLRHHTGHGIGLDGHEPPWLDPGDRTLIKPGMVFSCEPGLYVPGYAGFRHSDTVAITKKGMELITEYPRELADLKTG